MLRIGTRAYMCMHEHTRTHTDSDGDYSSKRWKFHFAPDLTEKPHEANVFPPHRSVAGNKAVFAVN